MDRGIDFEHGGANGRPTSMVGMQSDDSTDGIEPEPLLFKGPARLPDYIFILRPVILIPVWTFYLLGAYHGSGLSGQPIQIQNLLAGFLSFTALLGGIYIINQIADRDADLANRKLFLIPYSIVSLRAAWFETCLLTAASILIGFFFLPWSFLLILVLGLALGAAYSLEPVRLKKRAIYDMAANALGNGILNTLAGWVAAGAPLSGCKILLPYPLAVASVHLATTLADIDGDTRSGLRTSGILLGLQRGRVLSTALMVAAFASAALVGNRPAFYASLLSLPFFLVPARSRGKPLQTSGILVPAKVTTLIFSITAGFLFPLYIPFLAAVILLTRIYYRRRFNMSYPSL